MKHSANWFILCASASLMICLSSCETQHGSETSPSVSTAASTTAPPANTPVYQEPPVLEKRVVAQSGDAILAIAADQWYVQYWGMETDMLAYDAGITHIHGNGGYTVRINADTKGCRYETCGDIEKEFSCSSVDYAAVRVLDGAKLFPHMNIEITEIRVDGKPVEMVAANYTDSDDGIEMHSNIYHPRAKFSEDAHNADGKILATDEQHSACVVDPEVFSSWKTIEVDFNVTGC